MKKLSYTLAGMVLSGILSINTYAESYTFANDAEVDAFCDAHTTPVSVDTLKITENVSQAKFNSLIDVISSVEKAFIMQDLKLVAGEGDPGIGRANEFLSTVTLNGSIILKDCPHLGWIGGMEDDVYIGMPRHIKGDLVLDNISIPYPAVDGWHLDTSFGIVEQVDGDLTIVATGQLQKGGNWLHNLRRVGGNLTIHFMGNPDTWEFEIPNLTYVGGNIEYKTPLEGFGTNDDGSVIRSNFWGLESLKGLTYIGGGVKILNFNIDAGNRLNWGGGGDSGDAIGLCWIRQLIDDMIIDYACNEVVLGWEDDPLDISQLAACSDGVHPAEIPEPLPEKDPTCTTGIFKPSADIAANAYFSGDWFTVDAEINLSEVTLLTIDGKSVLKQNNLPAGQYSYPVGELANGIYIVKLVGSNTILKVVKLIK